MSDWNHNFTTLIREGRPTLWGNWALNANIKPGMVGTIDSASGNFIPSGQVIPQAKIDVTPLSQKWDVKSDDVKIHKTNITLDGSATDPETQTKITAGVEVTWGFEKKGSLSSSFAMTKEATVSDFPSLIKSQWDWLLQKASDFKMSTSDGIVQGFCVITDVIYAKSGLNVGANSEKSDFSITGSASGVNEMAGVSGSGKGSYVSTSETASMEKHLWPDSPNEIAQEDVPVAFALASFHGKLLIPNWTRLLSTFKLHIENNHGGTYIVDATLTYELPGSPTPVTRTLFGISGSHTDMISDIPIEAYNLKFTVSYRFIFGHDETTFYWGSPINQWASGQRHVDVYGVWANSPYAVDREA